MRFSAVLLFMVAVPLEAQLLQGVVRDSVSRLPIPGVVVSLTDSSGRSVARTLSDQVGGYRVLMPAGVSRIRLQRLGFRMRETPAPSVDGIVNLDLTLAALPSLLEPVQVLEAARCPRRRDNAQAQALYEQARAGLLATIVARETNPATIVRYAFERPVARWADSAPVKIRIDSTKESTTSFRAMFNGEEFVQFGFQRKVGAKWQYFGPDADVLLDDGFASGYCFSIAERDRSRRSQIGLSFAAATKQKDRVDIVGTLWIDTIARALRTIEYRYTGVTGLEGYMDTGGRTSFLEMSNGVAVVTQWGLRLLHTETDTLVDRFGNEILRPRLVQNEGGGFLAKAVWPDGTRWVAPMGAARLRLMINDTTPVAGAAIRLATTDHRGTTDTSGFVEIPDLFPGKYRVIVRDTLLEELGFEPEPQLEFVAIPGSVTERTARVQSTAELLLRRCFNKTSRADLVAVINVKDAAVGAPGVKVDFTINGRSLFETTRTHGNIVLCFDRSALGAGIEMVGTRGDQSTQRISHTINRRVTLFRLQLAPKPPSDRDDE